METGILEARIYLYVIKLHKIPLYRASLGYKIEGRVKARLYVKVDYKNLSDNKTMNALQTIDKFIWLERNERGASRMPVSKDYFISRMNLCLSLENRSFLDFDGYFGVLFPAFKELDRKQHNLVSEIAEAHKISGFTKSSTGSKDIFDLICGN